MLVSPSVSVDSAVTCFENEDEKEEEKEDEEEDDELVSSPLSRCASDCCLSGPSPRCRSRRLSWPALSLRSHRMDGGAPVSSSVAENDDDDDDEDEDGLGLMRA